MRKRKRGRKLSRKRDVRRALLRSLAAALILRAKIKTTEAKAKEVSAFVEKFVSIAKKGDLASQRRLNQVFTPLVVKKLIKEIGPRYQTRKGGYTRIIKLGLRRSDGAKMAFIEFVK